MIKMKKILILIMISLTSCKEDYPPLETVPYVDIKKYLGTWYEIASFPNSFQKDCTGTTANYTLKSDGEVSVVNQCYKFKPDGEESIAKGIAQVVDTSTNSKLRVSFFWPFFGDYWIIDLADDYSYAVVGNPSREYLWILSRTRVMNEKVYNAILERVKAKGFNTNYLKRTLQPLP
jgi:apolipoprotein D and lipocalin family protein